MNDVLGARFRLAALWLSQTARVLADNCLRMVVVLLVAGAGQRESESAWHKTNVFFILPFLLLAPVNGAISNALAKRWVLVGSAAYCLGVFVVLAACLGPQSDAGIWCAGLAAAMIGAAIFSPTRYALLPAVSEDARVSLPRLNGWCEMGGAAALVLGLVAGTQDYGFPALVLAAGTVSLLAALPTHFPSDPRRSEPAGQAIAGFFRDFRRIVRDPAACGSMVAVAAFLALSLAGAGALLAYTGALQFDGDVRRLAQLMVVIGVGVALGSLVSSVQAHPRRSVGLVPFAATGMLLALVYALLTADLLGPSLVLGFMGGLLNAPLRAAYQAAVPADARGNAMAVANAVNYLAMIGLSGVLLALSAAGLSPTGQVIVVALLAALAAAAMWWFLLRDSFEVVLELLLLPFYRIHGYGPGLTKVPPRGPVLVIANHCAWFDPTWLGKVLPRHLYPMMTSDFYDLPGMRWLLKNVFHVIRVQASSFRRQAPELNEAIARLDQAGCVVVFPEGYLRRVAEPSVRMFGQGVWRILQARPETPVVVCWIEGGWGSYTSYAGGKPTKNKRMDFWRRIDVAVSESQLVPPDILADSRSTRLYLMRACLQARGYLGLDVPPLPEMVEEESEGRARPQEQAAD
jgi:1-acyl-sn-glycerol-3-phosphate acyltransferase